MLNMSSRGLGYSNMYQVKKGFKLVEEPAYLLEQERGKAISKKESICK